MLLGRKPIGTVAFLGGVPAVLTPFCRSWGKMLLYTAEYVCEKNETVHVDDARISFHSWARNDLAERMLGDWLLMLDTDHEFEPDLLARLLHRMNTHDLDVVVGLYQFKSEPHAPVLYGWHRPGPDADPVHVPIASWGDVGNVFEVAGSGAGCLLVRRRVFDRIRDELGEKPFDVIGQGGEDLSFFRRLHKLGIKTYCDPRVECRHLRVKALGMDDYDPSALETVRVRIADAEVLTPEGSV